jgi:hypothetical protein
VTLVTTTTHVFSFADQLSVQRIFQRKIPFTENSIKCRFELYLFKIRFVVEFLYEPYQPQACQRLVIPLNAIYSEKYVVFPIQNHTHIANSSFTNQLLMCSYDFHYKFVICTSEANSRLVTGYTGTGTSP